ncbi:CPBP family intramembrane glutamic endopeptidase [Hathewaya histolytica]|uniref:CPBP family intramembrane glutamic endopeptidase n=1 Tax=Hathewaya histolytica TaxID=1498 RepID=UPI003B67696B
MKRAFKVNILFLIIIVLQISLVLFGAPLSKYIPINLVLIIGSILFVYMPAVIYILVNKQSFKDTLKLNKLGFDNALSCGLIFLLLLPVTSFCNLLTSVWFKNNIPEAMGNTYSGSALLFFFTLAVMPAIGEELVMRGVILDGYKKINIHKAAVVNGFLFAVLHLNPPQFLYAFILGVIFSYLVVYTNSLFSSMLVHFLFNGLSSLVFILTVKLKGALDSNTLKEAANTASVIDKQYITALVISGLVASVCLLVIALLLRKLKIKNNYEERFNFKEHTFNLEENNDNDEFARLNPKKSKIIAYSPILISFILFMFIIILSMMV